MSRTLPVFPTHRGQCAPDRDQRRTVPCPWTRCRYHLDADPAHSCALDLADDGPMSLDDLGLVMGMTGEGVRQVLRRAMARLRETHDEDTLREALGPRATPAGLLALDDGEDDEDEIRMRPGYVTPRLRPREARLAPTQAEALRMIHEHPRDGVALACAAGVAPPVMWDRLRKLRKRGLVDGGHRTGERLPWTLTPVGLAALAEHDGPLPDPGQDSEP